MSRPRIILHIGRNKAGSTTIQEACLASRDLLAATGIGYGLFGHLWESRDDVIGWPTFGALAEHARRHPQTAWLVSNEFMFGWPPEYTREAARALAGCDVSIVAYVRRYDHWLRSAYAEATRVGTNRRDIDAYVEHMWPRTSALPDLREWAACFGWARLRVRSLHPADLMGGDLLHDFAHAIGLDRGLAAISARNVAPGWAELELIRRLTRRNTEGDWEGADREAVLPLAALMRGIAHDLPEVQYLSRVQGADLRALYHADAAILRAHGQDVAATLDYMPERPFLPAFERIPTAVREAFLAAAAESAFVASFPAAADAAARLGAKSFPFA